MAEAEAPKRIVDYLDARRGAARDAFRQLFPHPALVYREPEGEGYADFDDAEEGTNVVRVNDRAQTLDSLNTVEFLQRMLRTHVVAPIVKSDRNLYRDMIAVGRAPNNDIVLRHRSVSKFHAYFKQSGGGLCLFEGRSRNGTLVNWKRLEPGRAEPVLEGFEILFGELSVRFHTPEGLYDFLGRLL